jgi:hypothetical protein
MIVFAGRVLSFQVELASMPAGETSPDRAIGFPVEEPRATIRRCSNVHDAIHDAGAVENPMPFFYAGCYVAEGYKRGEGCHLAAGAGPDCVPSGILLGFRWQVRPMNSEAAWSAGFIGSSRDGGNE